jgi:hypothetical protein
MHATERDAFPSPRNFCVSAVQTRNHIRMLIPGLRRSAFPDCRTLPLSAVVFWNDLEVGIDYEDHAARYARRKVNPVATPRSLNRDAQHAIARSRVHVCHEHACNSCHDISSSMRSQISLAVVVVSSSEDDDATAKTLPAASKRVPASQ